MNTFKAFNSMLIISNNILLFIHSHYQFEERDIQIVTTNINLVTEMKLVKEAKYIELPVAEFN